MRITDDNTLEDIQGVILCLEADIRVEAPRFPVPPTLRELIVRIDDKLNRNTNAVRRNWFTTAREHALAAEQAFLEGRAADSCASLRLCWEYLERGNKAHKRRATFVAGADGQILPVAAGPGEPGATRSPDDSNAGGGPPSVS